MSILTPDQRLRVFVSSTLHELAAERRAARAAVTRLGLTPVMFELGARPHPPRELYRSYLEQSHVFVGLYGASYGWTAPDEAISGLEDEYRLAGDRPKLIYVKAVPEREARLGALLERIRQDDTASYKPFSSARELRGLLADDLALLLTERFTASAPSPTAPAEPAPATPLPVPPTPLVGREAELRRLRALLDDPGVRLVTLLGPGGVGKSRLALEAARLLQPEFGGGVFFVPLAAVRDPALVASHVAQALGVGEAGGGPLLETLENYLRDKRLLLVLDNFEQVEGAAPAVGELLAAAAGLRVLVTSRAALRLRAERVFEVPPLALPEGGRAALGRVRESPAVALFVARAEAARPEFALTQENVSAVADICRRLDGLPLALELAAARTPLLTPQALLKRLEKRLPLLSGGPRDLPDRQRTLRGTIDWSFELLGDEEKRLFATLGVFAGGFTLDAAEAVCGEACADLLGTLASLVDKSLVRAEGGGGEGRFGLLETVREYAAERLGALGEAEATWGRHADFFSALAEEARPHLTGEQQIAWLNRLAAEHDNLRTALSWTAAHRPGEPHARFATALIHFWWIRGFYREGRGWLEGVLEQLGETSGYRGRALDGAGVLAWVQGDYAAARTFYEASLTDSRRRGKEEGIASALGNLGIIALEQSDLIAAKELLEEGLAINRRLNNQQGLAPSLINLAIVTARQEDYALARTQLEEALAINRRLGDTWGAATALISLGGVLYALGEHVAAKAQFAQSLRLAGELHDKEGAAYALEGFASVAAAQGQANRAARLWGAAEALREAIGNPRPPSGGLDTYLQDVELARAELGEAAFYETWAEGRMMGLEQAVALALQDAPTTSYDVLSADAEADPV